MMVLSDSQNSMVYSHNDALFLYYTMSQIFYKEKFANPVFLLKNDMKPKL